MTTNDPMAAIREYIDGFNNGDQRAQAAACADPMQILDGMSPHVWQGPTAAQDWWNDALAEGEHLGVSDYHIDLGEPRHVDVTGDFAYVAVPVTFSYNVKGTPVNPNWRALHGGASQGRRRLAFNRLDLDKRNVRAGRRRFRR